MTRWTLDSEKNAFAENVFVWRVDAELTVEFIRRNSGGVDHAFCFNDNFSRANRIVYFQMPSLSSCRSVRPKVGSN